MAWTITRDKSIMGNKAVVGLKVITDSATTAIDSGLKQIDYFSYAPASMGTSNIHININKGISSTSIVGTVAVTGCASGDEFYLVVFGTR